MGHAIHGLLHRRICSSMVAKRLKEKVKECEQTNHFSADQLALRAAPEHTAADCVVGILSDGRSPSQKNERTFVRPLSRSSIVNNQIQFNIASMIACI